MAVAEPPPASSAGDRPVAGAEPSWIAHAVARLERRALWVLAAMLAVDLAILLYAGRGLTFYYDEWNFVESYGGGWHSLLESHAGNIIFFPALVYKVLFHLVGLNHYAIFRLTLIVLHLIAGALVFVLAGRRTSRVNALLATALIVFLDVAWEDLIWAFQIGYLLSIVTGLAAWLLIERDDRRGDLATMAFMVVSVGSSSLGLAVACGLLVELAWQRQWRRLWLVVVPLVIYALWYVGYGESQVTNESITQAPGFVADLGASATGALFGRGLEWGRPLAAVGVLLLCVRLIGPRRVSPRLAGLITAAIALWVITAVARSTVSSPETGRYTYLGALAIVLIGVELLRGVPVAPRVTALAAVFVAYAALTGLTTLNAGETQLRSISRLLTAELGSFELGSAYAASDYRPDPYYAPTLEASPYLHAVHAIGSSPADSLTQIVTAEAGVRSVVDAGLVKLEATLSPAGALGPAAGLAPPAEYGQGAGKVTRSGSCVRVAPTGPLLSLPLRIQAGSRLLVRASPGPGVTVLARRFGDVSAPQHVGVVPGGGSEVLLFRTDAAGAYPWYATLSATRTTEACTL
jgi:hypothetical protein